MTQRTDSLDRKTKVKGGEEREGERGRFVVEERERKEGGYEKVEELAEGMREGLRGRIKSERRNRRERKTEERKEEEWKSGLKKMMKRIEREEVGKERGGRME